ncbi:hypothetical protein V8C35DRAFT_121471 [Trichoderma chlorosporum]
MGEYLAASGRRFFLRGLVCILDGGLAKGRRHCKRANMKVGCKLERWDWRLWSLLRGGAWTKGWGLCDVHVGWFAIIQQASSSPPPSSSSRLVFATRNKGEMVANIADNNCIRYRWAFHHLGSTNRSQGNTNRATPLSLTIKVPSLRKDVEFRPSRDRQVWGPDTSSRSELSAWLKRDDAWHRRRVLRLGCAKTSASKRANETRARPSPWLVAGRKWQTNLKGGGANPTFYLHVPST